MESFKLDFFNKYFPDINFIQENESQTNFGVLRGLHFQKNPHWQSKLVRVVEGKVQDVVVDLRKDSLTFGKYQSFILSSENKHQLFIPKGLAHGFLTLSKKAIFQYKVDNKYEPLSELGIYYNNVELNIEWMLPDEKIILSDRDKKLKDYEYKLDK